MEPCFEISYLSYNQFNDLKCSRQISVKLFAALTSDSNLLWFWFRIFQIENHTDMHISLVATMFDSEKKSVANKLFIEHLFLLDKAVTIESVLPNSILR